MDSIELVVAIVAAVIGYFVFYLVILTAVKNGVIQALRRHDLVMIKMRLDNDVLKDKSSAEIYTAYRELNKEFRKLDEENETKYENK